MKTRLISLFLSAAMLIPAIPAKAETTTITSNDGNIVYDIDFLPEEKQAIRYWAVSTMGYDLEVFPKTDYGMYAQYYREMGANFVRAWIKVAQAINKDGSISEEKFIKMYNQALGYLQKAGIKDWQWIVDNDLPEGTYYYDSRNWRKFTPEGFEIYCDYVIEYLKIMKKHGLILPVALGFLNEPNDPSHNAMGEEFKLLAKTMKKKMIENGFEDIALVGPEAAAIPQIEPILGSWEDFKADSEYSDAIDIVSYHSYYQNNDKYNEIVEEFADTMQKDFPEKEVWMTELCVLPGNDVSREGNYAFNVGMHMMRTLCADLEWCGANAWMLHGGVANFSLYEDGFIKQNGIDYMALDNGTYGYGADLNNTFTALPFYWMIRELFTKAPAGSVVHPMSSNDPDIVNGYAPLTDLLGLKTKTGQLELIANPTNKEKYYNLNNLEGTSAVIKQISSDNPGMFNVSYRNIKDNRIKNVYLPPYTLMYVETTDDDLAAPVIKEETKEKFIYNEGNKYYIRENEAEFTVTLDEPARVTVNGKGYSLDENNQFSFKADFRDGNKYEIKAIDKNCNNSESSIILEYSPNFVSMRLDEYSANNITGLYEVRGMSNAQGTISCNDTEVEVDENHRFVIPCELTQGMNELVVVAKDSKGNLSEPKTVKVFCDSVKPTITPDKKSIYTELNSVVVAGKVSEALSSLKIAGKEVSLTPDNSFSHIVPVNEPQTQVKIEAVDMYGNISVEYVEVNYTITEESPHRVDGQMYARSTKNQIVIDGEFKEGYKLDIIADKSVEGVVNNIVKWGAMWDSNNLYIAASVQDGAVCFSGDQPYTSDCIEIFLNPSAQRSGAYVDKDRQLWSAYVNNSKTLYKNSAPFNSAWKLTEDGYQVEISIPWSSIGISPQDGTEIGFDITCNDNDEGGTTRQSVVTWNGNDQNYANTSGFGLVILSAKDEVEYLDKIEDATEDVPEEVSSYQIEFENEIFEWKAARFNNQIMLPASSIEKALGVNFEWSIGSNFRVDLAGGHSLYIELYGKQVVYDGETIPITSTTIADYGEVYIPQEIMEKYFKLTFDVNGDKVILRKI